MSAPVNGHSGWRPSGWAWLPIGVVGVLVGALGALGVVVSFESVEAAVEPSFGDLAWTVPVGVDVGIGVFTALDLVMSVLGTRRRWLPWVPRALTGVTIYLNVAAETTGIGAVAHGVLPFLWVVAVEGGVRPLLEMWVGLDHGRRRGVGERVRLPASRWLVSPLSSGRQWWRARHLELPVEVRRVELAQDLALSALQDTYRPLRWRWKAPRWQRTLYRHGALTPTHVGVEGIELDDVMGVPTSRARSSSRGGAPAGGPVPGRRQAPPTTRGRRRNGAGKTNGTDPAAALPAELVEAGRRIARQLATEGRRVTRDELAPRIRAEGVPCPNDKAGPLLALLQAEQVPKGGDQ